MSNLYEMTLTVSITVEAPSAFEARRECNMIARDFIRQCPDLDDVKIANPNNMEIREI